MTCPNCEVLQKRIEFLGNALQLSAHIDRDRALEAMMQAHPESMQEPRKDD